MRGRFLQAAMEPILGAGIPFSSEWSTLLAILVLLAVQTALAYRRGKVEPLPPGGSGQKRSPARVPEAGAERARPKALLEEGREGSSVLPPSQSWEGSSGVEALGPEEGGIPLPPIEKVPSPRPGAGRRQATAFSRRLREPMGAREAFLGAEALWNPPVALRDPRSTGW